MINLQSSINVVVHIDAVFCEMEWLIKYFFIWKCTCAVILQVHFLFVLKFSYFTHKKIKKEGLSYE